MSNLYSEGLTFEKQDYSRSNLPKGDYENCIFINCDFNASNLTGINFISCEFNHCNLSLAKLNQSSFRLVNFSNCKLLGLHFEYCNDFLFEVNFENCLLNLSSFYKLKMKKTIFNSCQLNEVDFTLTDLSQSSFINCDLQNALFENTNLEKTDLRSAFNFSINPNLNKIKKAKVSQVSLAGFLHVFDLNIE